MGLRVAKVPPEDVPNLKRLRAIMLDARARANEAARNYGTAADALKARLKLPGDAQMSTDQEFVVHTDEK